MFAFSDQSLRSIVSLPEGKENAIFLSFDDGPCPNLTPQILDLLEEEGAKATFFVVGRKAKTHSDLLREMLQSGHAIGNHSYDHNWVHYFFGIEHHRAWLKKSEDELNSVVPQASVGFRPPIGIQTPPLQKALRRERLPLVLWNQRFYDQFFTLSEPRIDERVANMRSGDIILLHDAHRKKRHQQFLHGLRYLVRSLRSKGFALHALSRDLLRPANCLHRGT